MARYIPSIAGKASTVTEIRRYITSELGEVGRTFSSIPNVTSGDTFPVRPRLGEEFYLTAASGGNPAGWYKFGPGSVGWVQIG